VEWREIGLACLPEDMVEKISGEPSRGARGHFKATISTMRAGGSLHLLSRSCRCAALGKVTQSMLYARRLWKINPKKGGQS
jgi:hypothetical protein